jgi:hypothetical protein
VAQSRRRTRPPAELVDDGLLGVEVEPPWYVHGARQHLAGGGFLLDLGDL